MTAVISDSAGVWLHTSEEVFIRLQVARVHCDEHW